MGYDDTNNGMDDERRPRPTWPTGEDAGAKGRGANGLSAYQAEEEEDETPTRVGAAGRWVSRGGVLVWEEPAEAPAQPESEAESRWAADELHLPPGAPVGARIRAVRAWLLAQRQAANEALGVLLLEQRRIRPADEESQPTRRAARETSPEESPLALAMAEQQAAMSEYERLFEALADLETHIGPPRVLVEFYLSLTDRLAELANAPEAPPDFAPHLRTGERPAVAATAWSAAEWEGRASAVVQTRRRIERMTEPETEE